MQGQKKGRHRGETQPSTLRVRGVGGVALPPEGANDFPHWGKCSEYTGLASLWGWLRPASAAIARSLP
jgi:hypothetical protein